MPRLTSFFFAAMLAISCLAVPPAYAQDTDCDGDADASDNCIDKFNPTQEDIDGDLIGDRCDDDKDGDTALNDADNCPRDANATQDDTDGDTVGDACDQCSDAPPGDPINRHGCTIDQLCPCDGPEPDESWKNHADYFLCVKKKAKKFARHDLINSDERRAIVSAARADTCGSPEPGPGDNDGDGILDVDDNCDADSNPSQLNTDGDAFGNACDTDKDDDGVLNADDNCPIVANGAGQGDDADGDGVGDTCDVCSGTGLDDPVDRNGCSVDQACPCEQDEDGNPWKNHGKYVRCVVDQVFRFRLRDQMTLEEADGIKSGAATSDCGDRPPVCE